MLRRIKRFLGFSSRGAYFPNDEVAPTADGSIISNGSRKSTKSEKKAAKKEKKKSPLCAEYSAPAMFHVPTPPSDIANACEESIDRHTNVTDSLPYRDPSDKIFLESPVEQEAASSSCQSVAGSSSMKSRFESIATDESSTTTLPHVASSVESIYSTDLVQLGKISDTKSRELPVDCDIPNEKSDSVASCKSFSIDNVSPIQSLAPADVKLDMLNAELDGLLKINSPPFQVSTARLPRMNELPPQEDSMCSGHDEFDDSKNNSAVARYVNESHEVMMRSPENKHLRSCGY